MVKQSSLVTLETGSSKGLSRAHQSSKRVSQHTCAETSSVPNEVACYLKCKSVVP